MIQHNKSNIKNISSGKRHKLKPYLGEIITVLANLTNDYRDGKSFRLLVSCYLKEIHINVDHLWVETKKIAAVPEGPITIRACIIKYENNGSEKYGIKIVDEWTKSSKEKKDQYKDPFKAQKKYVDLDKRLFQMFRKNEDKFSEQKGNKGINLESGIPGIYGRKMTSESNIEYNKRHLEYGYVKTNSYILGGDFRTSYNVAEKQLLLETDINVKSRKEISSGIEDFININQDIAIHINKQQYGDIYSKYIYEDKKLIETFNLIFEGTVYRVFSNENEKKKDAKIAEEQRKKDIEIAEEKSREEDKQLLKKSNRRKTYKVVWSLIFKILLTVIVFLVIISILGALFGSGFFGIIGALLLGMFIFVSIPDIIEGIWKI